MAFLNTGTEQAGPGTGELVPRASGPPVGKLRCLFIVLCRVGGVSLGEVWAVPVISSLWVAWRLFCEGACTGLLDVTSASHTSAFQILSLKGECPVRRYCQSSPGGQGTHTLPPLKAYAPTCHLCFSLRCWDQSPCWKHACIVKASSISFQMPGVSTNCSLPKPGVDLSTTEIVISTIALCRGLPCAIEDG